MNLHYRAAVRREMEMQARIVEAVATAYSGVKSEKGKSTMRKILGLLRGK